MENTFVTTKKSKLSRMSKSAVAFTVFNYFLLTLLCLVLLYPFIYMISVSLSHRDNILDVVLLPIGLQFKAYGYVFGIDNVLRSFFNTILYTLTAVVISVILTTVLAYALSKKYLYGRSFFNIFVLFTMYFSGGLIPSFILITSLGFQDSILAMVVPAAINTYNLIVMRTYFTSSVPADLEESARIDGAGQLRILLQIFLPLSMPIIATVTLFYFVGNWNSWFGAMIYLSSPEKFPAQLVLRNVLENAESLVLGMGDTTLVTAGVSVDSINYAFTTLIILPLIVIFPFLQKFFIKGVMIGSLKG